MTVTKVAKCIISTTGHCLPGDEHVVKRHRRVLENGLWATEMRIKRTARPSVVSRMFDVFSVIDIHDHYRQGTLGLEFSWKTDRWWHRLFATIFGIILTDCFFAYRRDYSAIHGNVNKMLCYEDFLEVITHTLIFWGRNDSVALRERVDERKTDTVTLMMRYFSFKFFSFLLVYSYVGSLRS